MDATDISGYQRPLSLTMALAVVIHWTPHWIFFGPLWSRNVRKIVLFLQQMRNKLFIKLLKWTCWAVTKLIYYLHFVVKMAFLNNGVTSAQLFSSNTKLFEFTVFRSLIIFFYPGLRLSSIAWLFMQVKGFTEIIRKNFGEIRLEF